MSYHVELAPRAYRELQKLDGAMQQRIRHAIEGLANNPRPAGVRKMQGADDLWRIRIGDYRVIYEIHDQRLIILVLRIAHRRDAYR